MKKWAALVAATALLSGCAQQTAETIYFDQIREIGGLENSADTDIHDLGITVCDLYETGADTPTALKALIDNGIEAGDAGKIVALSINQYCPEHLEDSGF